MSFAGVNTEKTCKRGIREVLNSPVITLHTDVINKHLRYSVSMARAAKDAERFSRTVNRVASIELRCIRGRLNYSQVEISICKSPNCAT